MRGLADGNDRSAAIVQYWSEAYSWRRVTLDADLRGHRQRLGDALVTATAEPASAHAGRARLAQALIAFQFEEGLERLADVPDLETTLAALRQLRVEHELEQRTVTAANDWSDLEF